MGIRNNEVENSPGDNKKGQTAVIVAEKVSVGLSKFDPFDEISNACIV